jgi:basic amino acid/polyamine antiporter, APA family
MGYGTKMEPLLALGVALVWGIYGAIYFTRASRKMGKTTLIESQTQTQAGAA